MWVHVVVEEQLSIAKMILGRTAESPELIARQVLRLATITLELTRKLSAGVPLPGAWLTGVHDPSVASDGGARPS